LAEPVDNTGYYQLAVAQGAPLFIGGNTLPRVAAKDDAFVEGRTADGKAVWYTADTAKWIRATAATPSHAFFVSEFFGTFEFAGVKASARETGAFIARMSHAGALQWSHVVQSSSYTRVVGVAAAPDGGATVALGIFGRAKDGALAVPHAGSSDAVVIRYDGAGAPAWVKTFGWAGYDEAAGIFGDADGGVTVAGTRWKSPDMWASALADGRCHGWVARLDARGEPRWSIDLGTDTTRVTVTRVVAGANGETLVMGAVRWRNKLGALELDGGAKDRAYLAAVDREGRVLWARFRERPDCMVVDAAGRMLVADKAGVAVETTTGESTPLLAFDKDSVTDVTSCELDGEGHLYLAGMAKPGSKIGGVPLAGPERKRPKTSWLHPYSSGFVAKIVL
jgi:hypothetical protein